MISFSKMGHTLTRKFWMQNKVINNDQRTRNLTLLNEHKNS